MRVDYKALRDAGRARRRILLDGLHALVAAGVEFAGDPALDRLAAIADEISEERLREPSAVEVAERAGRRG